MDGADDATDDEKLPGLIDQIDPDRGDEVAASKAGHLPDGLHDRTGGNPRETTA